MVQLTNVQLPTHKAHVLLNKQMSHKFFSITAFQPDCYNRSIETAFVINLEENDKIALIAVIGSFLFIL